MKATPGHDCPGLIEAKGRRKRMSFRTTQPLRGMIAPASLKPPYRNRFSGRLSAHSGA